MAQRIVVGTNKELSYCLLKRNDDGDDATFFGKCSQYGFVRHRQQAKDLSIKIPLNRALSPVFVDGIFDIDMTITIDYGGISSSAPERLHGILV